MASRHPGQGHYGLEGGTQWTAYFSPVTGEFIPKGSLSTGSRGATPPPLYPPIGGDNVNGSVSIHEIGVLGLDWGFDITRADGTVIEARGWCGHGSRFIYSAKRDEWDEFNLVEQQLTGSWSRVEVFEDAMEGEIRQEQETPMEESMYYSLMFDAGDYPSTATDVDEFKDAEEEMDPMTLALSISDQAHSRVSSDETWQRPPPHLAPPYTIPPKPQEDDLNISSVETQTVQLQQQLDSWFIGARKAGIWMIDAENNILCGYTRGKDVRWKYHNIGPRTKAMAISSNQQGHAWAADEHGNIYICVNYPADTNNKKTVVTHTCYENQRWWHSPRGWSDLMLPGDRAAWSDESGLSKLSKDSFTLPSSRWSWTSEWSVVTGPHTDEEGWQYAKDFHKEYSLVPVDGGTRRRAWKRQRRITDETPWVQVHSPKKSTALAASTVCSVGIGTNGLWVVTDNFEIFFRGGIVGDNHEGTEWRSIASPKIVGGRKRHGKVSVGPVAHVWLIAPDGQTYIRRNASVSNPIGTRWQIVKGPLMEDISVGRNLVWAVDVDGNLLYRRDVSAHKVQGKSWEVIKSPTLRSRTMFVACTPQPNLVQVINKAGVVFSRVGVNSSKPQGISWTALNFNGIRMKAVCCTAAVPKDQIELPPLVKGSWVDELRVKIAKRDFVERSKTMFSNYHTYNDASYIAKRRRGPLKWRREGTWNITTFELNGTTLTYSNEDQEDDLLQVIRPEILHIDSLRAIHGNCVEESTDGDETLGPVFRVEFDTRLFVLAAESQREKEGWMLSLLTAHADISLEKRSHAKIAVSRSFVPPSPDAIWALDDNGNPWYCEKPSFDSKSSELLIWYALKPYLRHSSWGCALGHFVTVTCAEGITWALGADYIAYVSNHHTLQGNNERMKVVNSTIEKGWTPVPSCVDDAGQPEKLTSIAMGRACLWATTQSGDVLIRWGISRECPVGETWQRVKGGEHKITIVRVSKNMIWGLTDKNALVSRQGFSAQHRCGSRWSLCNGLILTGFHLDGSPEMHTETNPEGSALPPSLPEYTVRAIDVASSGDQCFMIDLQNNVIKGRALSSGQVEWLKEDSQTLKQINAGRDEMLIGLSRDGELFFKNVGSTWSGFRDWTHMTSVSAYNPGKSLSWSSVCQGAGVMLNTKSTKVTVLANGHTLPRTQTEWGEIYCKLLQDRNSRLVEALKTSSPELDRVVAKHPALWQMSGGELSVGSRAIAYFPHDGAWYYGRIVGTKNIESEHCFLVKFANQVHMCLNRRHLANDKPPDSSLIYEGLHVLYSVTDWREHVKFAEGVIVGMVDDELYSIKSVTTEAKEDGAEDDEERLERRALANIRLLAQASVS